MKRFICFATTLLVLAIVQPAAAEESKDRSEMHQVLSSIDTIPTRDALQERFPAGEGLLVEIALDQQENFYLRKRATTLLSFYKSVEAARGLQKIATNDEKLRPFAVYTLARTFGDTADAALVGRVSAFLDDSNPEVREWTLRGLRWMRHADAKTALEKFLQGDHPEKLHKVAERSLARWVPANSDQLK